MNSENYPQVIVDQQTEIEKQSSEDEKMQEKSKKQQFKEIFEQMTHIIKVLFKWSTIRVMFSHHPYCDPFEHHTYKIGKLRLCRGCLLSYPPLYATLLIFLFWPQAHAFLIADALWFDNLWWFMIGFGILALVGRLLGRYSIFIKDLSKFGRGAWAGFLVVVIISQHWGFKIGAVLIIVGGMTYLSLHRGKDMEKTCDECEWGANYDACPGWKDINDDFSTITGSHNNPPQKQDLPILYEKPKNIEEEKKESTSNNKDSN